MTRVLVCCSGKGGVGKTTLTSNLATALTELGEDVIVVDGNLTTPHLGIHLGMHLVPKTLHDVLGGRTRLRDVIYPHPLGFKVIPGSMSVKDLRLVKDPALPEVIMNLLGRADFVILDCAAGLGKEALSGINAAEEIMLITNPDLPSVTDALKTIKVAERYNNTVVGVIVNRVNGEGNELGKDEIENMLEVPVLGEIPEDKNVIKAIAKKRPVVDYKPNSPASVEIKKIACKLCGKEYKKSFKSPNRFVRWLHGQGM